VTDSTDSSHAPAVPGIMRTLTATTVRSAFRESLDATEAGNAIVVTRYGAPWVVMVPVDRYLQIVADEPSTREHSERLEHTRRDSSRGSEDSGRPLPDT